MENKNIIFTFDYELFLGEKSGSIQKCLIEPTEKLLHLFSDFRVSPALFFVDTTWLLRLKELRVKSASALLDYEKVMGQLNLIRHQGHYIFPHLHPHWANADYLPEINQWQLLNYSSYRFHNLDKNEQKKIFDDSVTILNEILGSDYKPLAYRAGGWSIQPFDDFEPLFRQHGVKYDFSVLPGFKCISSARQYDFSNVSMTQPYSFSNDVTIQGKGDFNEFPISVVAVSSFRALLNRALLKYLYWSGDRYSGDGQSIAVEATEYACAGSEMVSVELLNRIKLPVYYKFIKNNDYMQFISHPKMLSRNNMINFKKFIKKITERYSVNFDFLKMNV